MKLIDALQESQWDYFTNCIYDCCNELGATDNISANCLINQLANMEINAVPVVRCRDCKHRGTDYCIFHIKGEPADEELLLKLDNDFCSYGERKGDVD